MLTSNEAALNRETYVTLSVSCEAVGKAGKNRDVNQLWSRELQTWGDWLHPGWQGWVLWSVQRASSDQQTGGC